MITGLEKPFNPTNAIRLFTEQFLNADPILNLSKEVGHLRIIKGSWKLHHTDKWNDLYCNGKMFITTLYLSRSLFLLAFRI
jgi:hypothetical protein